MTVNISGTRQVFEKSPEEVQRFIGATRAAITDDCPPTEIIKLRGLERKVGVFLAYTTRASGWRIQIFSPIGGILPMLDWRDSAADSFPGLPYLQTRTQFDRAKIPNVGFNTADLAHANHISWEVSDVDGDTLVIVDRSKTFRSLGDLSDAAAHLLVEKCSTEQHGTVEAPSERDIAPNIQTREFICSHGTHTSKIGIVIEQADNIATVFTLQSQYPSVVRTMMNFLADKHIVY